ncbi:MAG: prolipoprotein diacylglyceryl transferase [Deltaproteobacteria bacterium]|nr:prolipoprotein diacylglyceryl transferase [Deltaproteobacteria bacterium]
MELGDVARPIGNYGVMLTVAILVMTGLVVRAAARARLDVGATIATMGFVWAGAGTGAFMLFVLVECLRTGTAMGAITQPGGVFFGAPAGAAVALYLSCRAFGLPLGVLADLSPPAIAASHAVGRLGCFLGGCCYGAPSDGPLAVIYTHPLAPGAHPSILRHPTPLYEGAGLLVLGLVFALVPLGAIGSGRRLLVYCAAYGALRFVIELFRGDAVRGVYFGGVVSTSQLVALALVLGSVAALLLRPLPSNAPVA